MNARLRRVIGEAYRRHEPAALGDGKHGVRNITTGQLVDGAVYDTEVLARTKCLDLAAEEVAAYLEGAKA